MNGLIGFTLATVTSRLPQYTCCDVAIIRLLVNVFHPMCRNSQRH